MAALVVQLLLGTMSYKGLLLNLANYADSTMLGRATGSMIACPLLECRSHTDGRRCRG